MSSRKPQVKWELVQPKPETASLLIELNNVNETMEQKGGGKWNKKGKLTPGVRMYKFKNLLSNCTSSMQDRTEPLKSQNDIPFGLKCVVFDGFSQARTLLSAREDLVRLFYSLKMYNLKLNVRGVSIIENDGKIFWPSWRVAGIKDKTKRYMPVSTRSVLNFLEKYKFQGILKLFNQHYDDIIANIYSDKLSKEQIKEYLNKNSTMQFLKYDRNTGFNQHIDNLIRCDSTIITIGIGRNVVYDFSPVLHPTHNCRGKLVRLTLPEGSAVVMNDDSRYHWTHGIPQDQDDSVKYTIIWILHHTPYMIKNHMTTHKFSSILGCPMYSLNFH